MLLMVAVSMAGWNWSPWWEMETPESWESGTLSAIGSQSSCDLEGTVRPQQVYLVLGRVGTG
jgi:hypothetical protein